MMTGSFSNNGAAPEAWASKATASAPGSAFSSRTATVVNLALRRANAAPEGEEAKEDIENEIAGAGECSHGKESTASTPLRHARKFVCRRKARGFRAP